LLSVRNICKSLDRTVLEDVSFDVLPGRYFVLLGASGAGKTVLLEIMAGLMKPDAGAIYLNGRDITAAAIQSRGTALVFQENSLFPYMTVYENIAYPLRCRRPASRQISRRVAELANRFELGPLLRRYCNTLSGGEIKRVSLARAIASDPRVLLLDEPLCSLDAKARSQIRALLRKLSADGLPIVHVTHDYTEAAALADEIAVLENATIAQKGNASEIFLRPASEFVAHFVGLRNFFKGYLEQPAGSGSTLRRFCVDGVGFSILTNEAPGPGCAMIPSDSVTISAVPLDGSARNSFEAKIADVVPAGCGREVVLDIGCDRKLELAAVVSNESAEMLGLAPGKKVWVNFKASAVRYVPQ